ncbi:MAG: hypothetical protein ACQEW8_14285 [Actinomycetota bacterium]
MNIRRARINTTVATSTTLLLILLSTLTPGAASADANGLQFAENANLSRTEVTDRASELAGKYSTLGETLSPEDAEFVLTYLEINDAKAIQAKVAGTSFQKRKVVKGHTGAFSGNMKLNLSGALSISNSYNVSSNAAGTKGITKVRTCAHVRAYGVVGSSGVGLVYKNDPCSTVKRSSQSFSRSMKFSAYALAGSITMDATFWYKGGSFQLSS